MKEITFWDWKAGKLLKEIPANYAQALAFSTDGAKLASGDRDGTIHVYDWLNGKELQKFHNGTKAPTTVIAFCHDLSLAASTDFQQDTIHLWDLATGKESNAHFRGRRHQLVRLFGGWPHHGANLRQNNAAVGSRDR